MPARRLPRDQTFKKSDVMRAWKAARDAGIPNPSITIDRNGLITIIPGGNGAPPAGNPWDKVLTNAEDAKRPA